MLLRQVLLHPTGPQIAMARIVRDDWQASVPGAMNSPLLASLPSSESRYKELRRNDQSGSILSRIAIEGGPALARHLADQAAAVLRMQAAHIPLTKPLRAIGLDSLMGLELRNRLEISLGLTLPTSVIWNYPTIAELTTHLAAKLNLPQGDQRFGVPLRPEQEQEQEVSALDMLSAEIAEAEELLRRE